MSSQSLPYPRVLIKLSGQALAGNKGFGIDPMTLQYYSAEIAQVRELNVEIAIVIGGGNFFRGSELAQVGIDRITADHMGMLGTIMNCLAFRDALEQHGVATRIMSSIPMFGICEHYDYRNAMQHLTQGKVVLFAGGTGNPLVTTDTCASLRAIETKCDLLIKATGVNGIYNADPHLNPAAQLLSTMTFAEAIEKKYKVMDLSAFCQCQEHNLDINVCNLSHTGTLKNLLLGHHVGTRVIKSK
ncbi:UMP kinase [bacterium]|nr:UMP kinase [bacterium]NBW56319.1 UMP kinase [bacterium]NBX71997.1 UMP kinase [bacterium]